MNYCTKHNELCESANAFGYCSFSVPCSKHMKLTETYEWNHVHSTGINAIETTPEFFARMAEDEINVQKATDFLEKLGIQVKTEYGNYRPTYDVLRDIGDAMSRV